jgi:hypothetical protein
MTPDDKREAIADVINVFALLGDPLPLWLHAEGLDLGLDVQAILDNPKETITNG